MENCLTKVYVCGTRAKTPAKVVQDLRGTCGTRSGVYSDAKLEHLARTMTNRKA